MTIQRGIELADADFLQIPVDYRPVQHDPPVCLRENQCRLNCANPTSWARRVHPARLKTLDERPQPIIEHGHIVVEQHKHIGLVWDEFEVVGGETQVPIRSVNPSA